MTHHETTAALQRRIAKAESERDMARAAGTQEQYLSACVLIEALDLQLAMHLQAPIDGAGYAPQRATLSTSRSDPAPAPSADAPVADAPGDREAVMAEFGITFNGRDYEYRRYRYGSLADAVAYAKLRRDEPLDVGEATDLPPSGSVKAPTFSSAR